MARSGTQESAILSRRRALALLGLIPYGLKAAAPLRLGLSETLVSDVNVNDARAALLVWIRSIATDMNLPVEYKREVFDTTPEILRRIRAGQLDAVALNVVEARQVMEFLDSSEVIIQDDPPNRQYVLLVKTNGPIQKIGDLRGRKVIVHKARALCLSAEWINVLLWSEHLDAREGFFGAVVNEPKPAKVMLPVFFGQADSCLTTRRAFDAMCELNPQVAKQLKVLVTSPELASTCYMFRKGFKDLSRERWLKALSDLHTSITGRQLLTLFQADRLVQQPVSCLAGAFHLLDQADLAKKAGVKGIS